MSKILKNLCFVIVFALVNTFSSENIFAQYNQLWIPDTLSGPNFNLTLKDTFAQIRSGNQTITSAVNNNKFWGPTLLFNKGDVVHMNVQNKLNDSTTVHWHGMHLPAIMDGGPHQVIPPGTVWQPYWKVTNNAATYWYHPHLHEMTQEQMSKGLGGFIIVRDSNESALKLPRTYGVDDIPLCLTSRRFDANNAIVTTRTSYGDYMLVNGTTNPQVSLPKQIVRLRILNAEMERAYNIGFSDNRKFYVITNDGGLLDAPVELTRVILNVGERIEILVDLSKDNVNSSIDLKAYNSGFSLGFPGGEPNTSGEFGSLLNNKTFDLLHINVVEQTNNPILTIEKKLANNVFWSTNDANQSRTIKVTGGQPPGTPFTLDNSAFTLNKINHNVDVNNIEKWTIVNNNVFGHTFHIHDVQFKLLSRSNGPVADYESGWKDVLYLPINSQATFICKFEDYSDSIHPFMYHCHFAPHEDGGMMGQFVVKGVTNSVDNHNENNNIDFSIFPNPVDNNLKINFTDENSSAYYIRIYNSSGRNVMMLPRPDLTNGIDISNLSPGVYFLELTEATSKKLISRKFIKQ